MISIFQAIILGALQGVTEFLPVSSSGHLVVVQQLFNWSADGAILVAFDVALHIGTLAAILVMFRRDILDLLAGRNWNLFKLLILATIPAVIIGFGFKGLIEEMFTSATVVGFAWLVTGTFLWLTKYIKIESLMEPTLITWPKVLLIGCAQAIAIIPGISRSGSTVSAGMFLKLDGKTAAKFSFLMAIPAIGGGAILDFKDIVAFPKEGIWQLLIGMVVSFIVAYISIKWLLGMISKGKFFWFGLYCWAIGLMTLIYLAKTTQLF